jgi:hypothetical protein
MFGVRIAYNGLDVKANDEKPVCCPGNILFKHFNAAY